MYESVTIMTQPAQVLKLVVGVVAINVMSFQNTLIIYSTPFTFLRFTAGI
jgi:hypothetical protein